MNEIMDNLNDITVGTPVSHADEGIYRVTSRALTDNNVVRVSITKMGFGNVFHGTPMQARAEGFTFYYADGANEEVDIEALLTPEEPSPSAMRQAWLACEDANRELTAANDTLKREAAGYALQIDALTTQVTTSERALTEFKERVRNEVESAKKEHDLCIDGCNSFLEELGLPLLTRTWKVTVTRDHDGETLLTVTGVEADDDDAAADLVKENFTVTATVKRVAFDYEYDGEGDADWDCEDWDDDDYDTTDDEYAESHKDGGLSFTAEEE